MIRYYSCGDCCYSLYEPGFRRDKNNVGQPPSHACINHALSCETRKKFYGEMWEIDEVTEEQTMCPGFEDMSQG